MQKIQITIEAFVNEGALVKVNQHILSEHIYNTLNCDDYKLKLEVRKVAVKKRGYDRNLFVSKTENN